MRGVYVLWRVACVLQGLGVCESGYLLENHGMCLYVKQSIIYYTGVLRGVCVCGGGGGGGGGSNTHLLCMYLLIKG